MDIITLIETIGGIVSGFGIGMFTKSGRVKSQADAYKAMAEAYEYRINALHESINKCNEIEASHLKRISELNHSLDDKTSYIRELVQKLWDAEHETNRVNDILTEVQNRVAYLEKELGKERVLSAHYKNWRCEHSDCLDPRGRKPPNNQLVNQDYGEPKL